MERIDLLPVVKAYPALSRSYGEVSCVAGVQMSGAGSPKWIRLYPVPFRALDGDQQFRKYEPVSVEVTMPRNDRRPETRRPNRDSIQVVGKPLSTDHGWRQRRRFIEPLIVESMCWLQRQEESYGTSLGVFRPADVDRLVFEPTEVDVEKREIAARWAAQGSLFGLSASEERAGQLQALEQMPFRFKYRYRCTDPTCSGHEQSIIDWEIAQFYRQVRHHENWRDRMSDKWIGELCASNRDTALVVGNMHQHPGSFLVLGVWWPPREVEQLALDDLLDV
jgi:hypothetical protein